MNSVALKDSKTEPRLIGERFVTDIPGKCLVLPVLGEEKLYLHQVEMIAHNPWPRILPLEKRSINNQIRLYYRTDFQIPLHQYLTGTALTRERFINILESIVITLSDCKKYFLYENCFLLNLDYIYINPVTEAVALLYLPVETETVFAAQFKTMIKELFKHLRLNDSSDSLVFNKTVTGFLRLESFHLTELEQLVRELRFSRTTPSNQPFKPVIKPFELAPARADDRTNTGKKEKTPGDKRIKIMSLMALLQVIFLLILMIFSEKLKLLGDIKTTNTGIAVVLTAFNVFLINKLFK